MSSQVVAIDGPAYVGKSQIAQALAGHGFDVQLADHGYTRSHQVAVDVKKQGGGRDCAEKLEANDIICNYNLLPHDDPKAVQEMTCLPPGLLGKRYFPERR